MTRFAIEEHQTQPTHNSCLSTCIAMLVNLPAREVADRWNEKYHAQEVSFRNMLEAYHIPYTSFNTLDIPELIEPGAYMCAVPSLNISGGLHQIIIEIAPNESGGTLHRVLDPNQGYGGKRYYIPSACEPEHYLEHKLNGFIVDAYIPYSWLLNRTGRLA